MESIFSSATSAVGKALDRYERQRDEASAAEYEQNLRAARFEPPPQEVYRVREALRCDPLQATRFTMARYKMIEARAFFNLQNGNAIRV